MRFMTINVSRVAWLQNLQLHLYIEKLLGLILQWKVQLQKEKQVFLSQCS